MGWTSSGLSTATGAVAVLAAAAAVSGVSPSVQPASGVHSAASHIVFRIDVPQIKESSSLVVSSAHPGLIYTTNDSGDGPYIYVLDNTGRLVGTTTLSGVRAVDFEALSEGRDGSLVIGDIGDNDADRASVQLYKISAPTSGNRTVTPDKVTLTYADGARDAESVLYDSGSGAALVVSKETFAHVYTTPDNVFGRSSATLRRVASAPTLSTEAAWLPANGAVVVRTYRHAYVYSYPSWKPKANFTLPDQQQGESISRVPGRPGVVWVGSEGVDSPVWEVDLPPLPVASGYTEPAPMPTPVDTTASPVRSASQPRGSDREQAMVGDESGGSTRVGAVVATVGAFVVVGAGLALRAARRSRTQSDTPTAGG